MCLLKSSFGVGHKMRFVLIKVKLSLLLCLQKLLALHEALHCILSYRHLVAGQTAAHLHMVKHFSQTVDSVTTLKQQHTCAWSNASQSNCWFMIKHFKARWLIHGQTLQSQTVDSVTIIKQQHTCIRSNTSVRLLIQGQILHSQIVDSWSNISQTDSWFMVNYFSQILDSVATIRQQHTCTWSNASLSNSWFMAPWESWSNTSQSNSWVMVKYFTITVKFLIHGRPLQTVQSQILDSWSNTSQLDCWFVVKYFKLLVQSQLWETPHS